MEHAVDGLIYCDYLRIFITLCRSRGNRPSSEQVYVRFTYVNIQSYYLYYLRRTSYTFSTQSDFDMCRA